MHLNVAGRGPGVPLRAVVFLASWLLVFAGFGAGAASDGAITGDVIAGPAHGGPVRRDGTSPPPIPIAHREVRIDTPQGAVVATTTTDANGHFRVTVPPGTYVVRVAIVPGLPGIRQNTPGDVSVAAGQSTSIKIELDTGLR